MGVERNSGKTQHPDIWAGNLVCDSFFVFFFFSICKQKFFDEIKLEREREEKRYVSTNAKNICRHLSSLEPLSFHCELDIFLVKTHLFFIPP